MQDQSIGTQGDGGQQRVKTTSATSGRPRKDMNRMHVSRHGILSRYPLEALNQLGENIRQLRGVERILRRELQPHGLIGDLLFDRLWSSYLRCLLIARTESGLINAATRSNGNTEDLPRLQEAELPTLVWNKTPDGDPGLFINKLPHLLTIMRYDSHFAREFQRALGLLLALRNGGESALARLLINKKDGEA